MWQGRLSYALMSRHNDWEQVLVQATVAIRHLQMCRQIVGLRDMTYCMDDN